MNTIATQWQTIRQQIAKAAEKVHQPATAVQLIAVSKKQSAHKIKALYELGQRAFGESYLQEALDKIKQLQELNIEWHFIGPMQSNKTKGIAEHFDWVQSVDRMKIAQRLNDQRPKDKQPLNICLQLNYNHEASKKGFLLSELPQALLATKKLPKLNVRGLMVIPQKLEDETEQLQQFQNIAKIFQQLRQEHANLDTLSMGMSNDFAAAIQAGSQMIRVGSALMGARDA